MLTSIIIPVWNGEAVLAECLRAVFMHAGKHALEVICVDNASIDGSAALIRSQFPEVKLLSQPVNLGFAGGVNVGMAAASGDVFVLLNQDCLVAPGWLDGLHATFREQANSGIVGAVLEDANGAINHAGAFITRPFGYGRHHTETPTSDSVAEYVTGALFAIRRATWETIGGMDEEFYPAYYEESDYCYRARRRGIETYLSVRTRGRHLFSSREWLREPIRHTANQHQSRYRFICKQFSEAELIEFIEAEVKAAAAEPSFHESIGRALASAFIRQQLEEIFQRRIVDGNSALTPPLKRLLRTGMAEIYRAAYRRSEQLTLPQTDQDGSSTLEFEQWQQELARIHEQIQASFRALAAQRREIEKLYQPLWNNPSLPFYKKIQYALYQLLGLANLHHFVQLRSLQDAQVQNVENLTRVLDHRLNLLETQITLQEYRRRLSELLLSHAQR
ncbi:MAG: glycosyltransferase family 2 protein [Caldilinea sp.]|nr:glycosyltransferase family 2 protein [Caldilinea sp.]MDW8441382.1 glycosyltransferase family 2 protein [Caldilineaceae bacterium]